MTHCRPLDLVLGDSARPYNLPVDSCVCAFTREAPVSFSGGLALWLGLHVCGDAPSSRLSDGSWGLPGPLPLLLTSPTPCTPSLDSIGLVSSPAAARVHPVSLSGPFVPPPSCYWALRGTCLLSFDSVRRSSPLPNSVVASARPPDVRVGSSLSGGAVLSGSLSGTLGRRSSSSSPPVSFAPSVDTLDTLNPLLAALPPRALRHVRQLCGLVWMTPVVTRRVCRVF